MTGASDPSRILGCVDLGDLRALDESLEQWALLAESRVSLDVMALLATRGGMEFDDLRARVLAGESPKVLHRWGNRLARVAALLPGVDCGGEFAEKLLTLSWEDLTAGRGKVAYLKLLVELRASLGDWSGAREVVGATRVRDIYHGYIGADMVNPFVTDAQDFQNWLAEFNRPFTELGLTPVDIAEADGVPFNRLASTTSERVSEGPLVTVIQTVYNPVPEDVEASARSILEQTYQNIELLLVDDCSPEMPEGLMERIGALDPRVRVLRLPRNGGTYRARNFGLLAAQGEFVTGQDSDDWSHPERIARQVACISGDPSVIGVDTRANRMSDELMRLSLGMGPDRRCEASLMLRRADAVAIGGYLPARKAADSEFRMRLERWGGRAVTSLAEPLYLIRLSAGSLSRSDFRAGWSHQNRRSFYGAFVQWHAEAGRNGLAARALEGADELPFAGGPMRITGRPVASATDLCIMADWRVASERLVDEVKTLAAAGDVSVMHVDAPFSKPRDSRRIHPQVQSLINAGAIRRVMPDQKVSISTLLIRDPSIVHFVPNALDALDVGRVLVVAAPGAYRRTYDPTVVDGLLLDRFGDTVHWCVREDLDATDLMLHVESPVLQHRFPRVIDPARFERVSLRPPRGRIIIGRMASGTTREWPTRDKLPNVYPATGGVEVRVLGEGLGARRVMGWDVLPENWLEFAAKTTEPSHFWRALTCVMHFQRGGPLAPEAEDQLLEAAASGAVVIVDEQQTDRLGACVIRVSSDTALAIAEEFSRSPARTEAHRRQAQAFLRRRHSPARLSVFMSLYRADCEVFDA